MNTATYTADTMADMAADTTATTDISGYGNCSQRSSQFEVHQQREEESDAAGRYQRPEGPDDVVCEVTDK